MSTDATNCSYCNKPYAHIKDYKKNDGTIGYFCTVCNHEFVEFEQVMMGIKEEKE